MYTKINNTTLEVSKEVQPIKQRWTREILNQEIEKLTDRLKELNSIKTEMDKQSVISVAESNAIKKAEATEETESTK